MINKYDFEKNEIPKRGSLDRFPSFCVLFAMHHEIIYKSVISITLLYIIS